ncbi:MAG TPA: DVU3141 family protein [Polyangiaceae bacterium]|nr:DVU3141 family protein [Polyangiaceae bacterium]
MTLPARAYRIRGFSLPLGLVLGACSADPALNARDAADAIDTGRVLVPASESERKVLSELSALPSGKELAVGDARVVAEEPYASASGKNCRALQLTSGPTRRASHRLACSEGGAWFFVPDVFSGGSAVPE